MMATRGPSLIGQLGKIMSAINSIFLKASGVIVLAIVAVVAQDVFRRYLLHSPTRWALDVARYMFAYVVFLILAPALEAGAHVGVDLMYSRFAPRGQRVLSIIGYMAAVVLGVILFWQLTIRTVDVFADGRRFPAVVPLQMKYIYIIGPIGVAQFIFTAVVRLMQECAGRHTDSLT